MKYYFWILGCAMNNSDAERMSTILDFLGYTRTYHEKEADIFIVVSCSVRQSAILRIYGKVKELREYKTKNSNFTTILTGCVLEKDRKKLSKVFDIVMAINEIPRLPQLLTSLRGDKGNEAIFSNNRYCRAALATTKNDYLSITPHYESFFRAYVPISTGCDNFCSYCAVPYTRGREKSRPMQKVIAEVTKLVDDGYKEITLLGQNVNSYGKDLHQSTTNNQQSNIALSSLATKQGYSLILQKEDSWLTNRNDNDLFIQLLLTLDQIPGDHRIYFYSNHPKDMTDELIQTLVSLKHFPHYIHLPLQSGNDGILRKMNRHYSSKQYLELVRKVRDYIPDVNLTTDIIVGYPGETEEQFTDTVRVVQKADYDMAFIAKYSPRSGTVSAKQDDNIPEKEKIRREKILQEIVKASVLEHNKLLIDTTQKVLVDEAKGDRYYGRTKGYKVVEIKTDQTLEIGQFIDVKIDKVTSWKLFGSIE